MSSERATKAYERKSFELTISKSVFELSGI